MRAKRAFTLFEVLAVLAVIALICAMTLTSFSFLGGLGPRPFDKQLKNAVKRARTQAGGSGRQTALYYEVQTGELVIRDFETGAELFRSSMVKAPGASAKPASSEIPEISFIPVYPEAVEGFLSVFDMLEKVDCLRFYPDGASCAAKIEIKTGGGAETYYLHPFSQTLAKEALE